MPELNWHCLDFDRLSPHQLYRILRLRAEVFVVEQVCVYQDLDDYDQVALHLCGSGEQSLDCYARLLPPGAKYQEASIGRIISRPALRRQGLGKILVRQALDQCASAWPGIAVRISAQQRLEDFYLGFGFQTVSAPYLEDGIPHVEMLRPES